MRDVIGRCLGQVEEEVEAFDERGGHGGGGHAVDETGGSRREQVDRAEQHPPVACLLARRDLQELCDRKTRRFCQEQNKRV